MNENYFVYMHISPSGKRYDNISNGFIWKYDVDIKETV